MTLILALTLILTLTLSLSLNLTLTLKPILNIITGVTTHGTMNRTQLTPSEAISYSQALSQQQCPPKEYRMEDFPVFPTHHAQHLPSHYQQQEWPVRYQSSNMPTSAFFHITPPPPHVAFDDIPNDGEHRLDLDISTAPSSNNSPDGVPSPGAFFTPGTFPATIILPFKIELGTLEEGQAHIQWVMHQQHSAEKSKLYVFDCFF